MSNQQKQTPTIYAHFDGMCWPKPGEHMSDIEWRIRYAPEAVTRAEMLYAASVLSAYSACIDRDPDERNRVCESIQAAFVAGK